jgi:hypothetical protein
MTGLVYSQNQAINKLNWRAIQHFSFDGNFHAKEVPFSVIAFTKWDYGISQADGMSILQTDILNNLRLAEHKRQKKSSGCIIKNILNVKLLA